MILKIKQYQKDTVIYTSIILETETYFLPYAYSYLCLRKICYLYTYAINILKSTKYSLSAKPTVQTPVGSFWYLYLPQGSTIIQIFLFPGYNSMQQYPILKSRDDAYINPYRFSSIYCILGIGNGFLPILLFSFLKSDKNLTVPSFLVRMKVGAPHSEQFTFFNTPSWHRCSTSLQKKASFPRGTGYSLA